MDKSKIIIAMDVTRFPVRYLNFLDFLERSPELGYINFIGDKLFAEPEELSDILELCAKHDVQVEFSNLALTSPEAVSALVTSGAVIRVSFYHTQEEELKPIVDEIIRLRDLHKSTAPEIVCVFDNESQIEARLQKDKAETEPDVAVIDSKEKVYESKQVIDASEEVVEKAGESKTSLVSEKISKPESTLGRAPVPTSFGFYDLAGDLKKLPCGRLINYPLINFDGRFIGCWANYQDTPINAFKIGIVAAMNHKFVKRMCKMLYTGRLDVDIPCMRCPIFTSLVWANKRVRLKK